MHSVCWESGRLAGFSMLLYTDLAKNQGGGVEFPDLGGSFPQ